MTTQASRTTDDTACFLVCKWQAQLVSTLTDLGADVIMIVDRSERDNAHADPGWAVCSNTYDISTFDSLEELAAVAADLLVRNIRPSQVISHQEVSQHGAGYLETLLGLRSDPLHRVRLRDKRLMKQQLAAAGFPVARFASVSNVNDGAELHAASVALKPPYIVKPAAGFGTMSTVRLNAQADLITVADRLHIDPQIRSKQLIVEEFINGEELQIEMYWSGGELIHFVAFKYHVQRVSMMPLRRGARDGVRLIHRDEDHIVYDRLRKMCELAAREMGITDGTSQIEAFLDEDGRLTLSEIAGRGGGAWTPALMNQYLGYPVWDLIGRCHLRIPPRIPHRPNSYLASISIRPDTPGRITTLPSQADYEAQEGVLTWQEVRGVGDVARLHHPSDYYVHVIIGADDLEQLEQRCQAAQDQLTITTASLASPPAAPTVEHQLTP